MAIQITNTTQLNTYSIIKNLLKANNTLITKFKENNFYEYEPALKSLSFTDLPYIIINTPATETDLLTFSHAQTTKSLDISITVVVDWSARSKVKDYLNAIIYSIEAGQTTLEQSGYYSPRIELISSNPEIINQKKVIASELRLELMGGVSR